MKNSNQILLFAAIFGAAAVSIGAFGAHAAKPMLLAADRLDTFETAVKYHFYHTLALLLIGVLAKVAPHKTLSNAAFAMVLGILIFSGSLYALCFTGIGILGAITPIGGVAFIVGWAILGIYAVKHP